MCVYCSVDLAVGPSTERLLDSVPLGEHVPGREIHLSNDKPTRVALGVLVVMKRTRKSSQPTARVSVVAKEEHGEVRVLENFELVPRGSTLAAMLADLGAVFANRVTGLAPDTVVVRRADWPRRPSNNEGPKRRLLAEGALVHAAASKGASVVLLPGRDLAQQAGTTKDAMDAATESLAPSGYREAISAAVSALNRQPPRAGSSAAVT